MVTNSAYNRTYSLSSASDTRQLASTLALITRSDRLVVLASLGDISGNLATLKAQLLRFGMTENLYNRIHKSSGYALVVR